MNVTFEELAEYEFTSHLCGEYGKGANKAIDAVVKNGRVKYQVLEDKKVVHEGGCLFTAVKRYNEIKRTGADELIDMQRAQA